MEGQNKNRIYAAGLSVAKSYLQWLHKDLIVMQRR
jgi:hypothetical protein